MTNRILLSLFITITACSAKQSTNNPIEKEVLHGIWVREDYINSLKSTKSPSKSSEFLVGEVCLNINSLGLVKDTLNIGVSFNNHEGGDYQVSLSNFTGNKTWLYAPDQIKSNRAIEYHVTNTVDLQQKTGQKVKQHFLLRSLIFQIL